MQRVKRHIGTHHITSWKVFVFVISIILAGVFGTAYSIEAYPQVFKTEIKMADGENIRPSDPIAIDFSQPVMSLSYSDNISISPAIPVDYSWENSGKKLIIMPTRFWKPQTDYQIYLPSGTNAMLAEIPSATFSFRTINYPKVTKVNPKDGAQDVDLDIEDPIVVNFDNPTDDFQLKFSLIPETKVTYRPNDEKTEFKILPHEKLKSGASYKLLVYSKYKKDSDDGYREIFRSSFATLPPAPTTWEKNYSDRLEQARRFTKAKIPNGKYIDINLSAQILSIFEDGKMIMDSMISSGKRGMETPQGEYVIRNKAPRVWSKKYGLYMPYWMAVAADGSFGIHELPEWPGGYKEGANHLGVPVSHGCVRLGIGPARQVYDWTEVGTPVVIY